MDHDSLLALRQHHPAWHLLRADNAALVATTLHRVFVADNTRTIGHRALTEALDDDLYGIRATNPGAYPKDAAEYLSDWSGADRGWLRKFYPPDSDEPHYDLSPAAEKALLWLDSLGQRSFVGTESRLKTMFDLLRQMVEGTETDPAERIRTLRERRATIDAQIAAIETGELTLLDDTGLRDRYQQFAATAKALLGDFRQVEENFRQLDRGVREKIATWQGSRGALLEEVFGERDSISGSDQGVSFVAFWDFLMSSARQEEFEQLLGQVLDLPAISDGDNQIRYVLHDWLKAGDAVQRTVAHLSRQLRRFLDDQAYMQNRRIAELIRSVEAHALQVRDAQPGGSFAQLAGTRAEIAMPMARPLHAPQAAISIDDVEVAEADDEAEPEALFNYFVVDPARLRTRISEALREADQVTVGALIAEHGLQQGLAEIVTYLNIADDDAGAVFTDESEQIDYQHARIPKVIFTGGEQ